MEKELMCCLIGVIVGIAALKILEDRPSTASKHIDEILKGMQKPTWTFRARDAGADDLTVVSNEASPMVKSED